MPGYKTQIASDSCRDVNLGGWRTRSATSPFLDGPRGFLEPTRVEERRQLLETAPGAPPLRTYRDELIARRVAKTGEHVYVPDFDPVDAADTTRILFVLEAPGAMTNASTKRPGSGFISVDNNDVTAANVWAARDAAGLHKGCLSWNIVPWYLGVASTKPNADDLHDGALELARIVAACCHTSRWWCRKAHSPNAAGSHTSKTLERPLHVAGTWHPSPLALTSSERRQDFAATLEWAATKAQGDPADE